MRSIN